ncbi:roadblock/LC7 domain-containing protein [Streptomyces sp. NPDC090442]|uniref:roadblock/LC7 domain-containing protein n=1 Tax=Streptomyces sp. NPDC090442 TaxID=3365962 RepID=UPI0038130BF3
MWEGTRNPPEVGGPARGGPRQAGNPRAPAWGRGGQSKDLTVDQADQLAAIASGIQSLSHGASVEFGDGTGGVRQAMTEFHGGVLFIVEAGNGAHLALIAVEDADVGLIGFHMNELVEQIGEYLRAAPRGEDGSVA